MNKFLFKLYYNPHFKGVNKIPSKGPIVLCGNHLDVLDKNIIECAVKRDVTWYNDGNVDELKSILENGGVIGFFPERIINIYRLKQLKIMALENEIVEINNSNNRRGTDCMTDVARLRTKIDKEMEELNIIKQELETQGINVIDYDVVLPFDEQAVRLAKECDAKIVPFAITGDYQFMSRNLIVRFGKPMLAKSDACKDNYLVRERVKKLIYRNY